MQDPRAVKVPEAAPAASWSMLVLTAAAFVTVLSIFLFAIAALATGS